MKLLPLPGFSIYTLNGTSMHMKCVAKKLLWKKIVLVDNIIRLVAIKAVIILRKIKLNLE